MPPFAYVLHMKGNVGVSIIWLPPSRQHRPAMAVRRAARARPRLHPGRDRGGVMMARQRCMAGPIITTVVLHSGAPTICYFLV